MKTDAFQALAHPARRRILKALGKRPHGAGELADLLGAPRPTVATHCAVLKEADLVYAKREGLAVTYHLNVSVMEEAAAFLMDLAGVGRDRATEDEDEDAAPANPTQETSP